ncbi:MAG: hypothetical protein CMQ39_03185 [Gammaproteobacteria bacterium]|nr:hypothetical protein [Gammaproteobacteria bacterium]
MTDRRLEAIKRTDCFPNIGKDVANSFQGRGVISLQLPWPLKEVIPSIISLKGEPSSPNGSKVPHMA